MELMPGYKRSDVGVIPEDWKDASLGEVAEIRMCKRIFAEQTNLIGDIPFFKIGTFGRTPDAFISSDLYSEYKKKYSFPKKGDILLSAAGTLGKTVIYDGEDAYFQDSNIVWLEIDRNKIKNEYLYQCYQAIKWASPEGSTISRLYNGIIRNTKIPLPPTETEQHAIAEVLSDVDTLLVTLDQMIVKKRDLKQAAMQQLLTGKTRLPGFSGEWVEKSLSNTATLKARIGWQGLTTAEYLDAGDYLLVTGTDFKNSNIDWRNCYYVAEERYNQDKQIQLQLNDVLVTKDGTIGKVAFISELPNPATLNSGVFVIRPIKDAFLPSFFYFLLCSQIFTEFLNELCAGSTISHLYQKDFITFKYRTPPTLSEQAAIAKVLSDTDAELSVLESRRDKTRNIKQAMMQELLTGKTRLV